MKKENYLVAGAAFVLFFFFFLLSARIFIFNETYYFQQLEANKVRLPNAEHLATEVIGFLEGKQQMGDAFTANEKSHMEDVRKLVVGGQMVLWVLLLVIVGLGIAIWRLCTFPKKCMAQSALFAGIGVYAFLIVGALALYGFDAAFTAFHTVFFPQGNWQFPAGSTLITLFPEGFFQTIAKDILLTFLMFGTLMVGGGVVWIRWLKARGV
ncbi:DUF1461 domain-containing protein [Candidatus Woesearchaeota archaeon]|nr:DUF1461 domain-containing protein [Candidatus Woesearchaeota archaeon]